MKIWKNTSILDEYLSDYNTTSDKTNADIAIVGSKLVTLKKFKKLKGIFRVGVGLDNIPLEQAKHRNIKVKITSNETNEYIFEETANFTCYLILKMMFNNFGTIDPWLINIRKPLKEKILLIVGQGNIGKRVMYKMKNFMHVKTFDLLINDESDLNKFLSIADCVSLHIPLTKKSRNFFDADKLSMMKSHSVLINTSRGEIVSEEALFLEIKNDRLKAAFDVFWQKPYNGKLKQFYPNKFFMTPHVASKCDRYLKSAANDFIKFIEDI